MIKGSSVTFVKAQSWFIARAQGRFTCFCYARGVIYNVPLDIPTNDISACLAGQGIQSVRRFRYKRKDSSEMTESKSVFLQLTTADLSSKVKLGYMLFRVKQYIPRPLRCFKCNRYGHVATRAYARSGFGVNPPLELDILQKFYYLCKEINCFRILFAC